LDGQHQPIIGLERRVEECRALLDAACTSINCPDRRVGDLDAILRMEAIAEDMRARLRLVRTNLVVEWTTRDDVERLAEETTTVMDAYKNWMTAQHALDDVLRANGSSLLVIGRTSRELTGTARDLDAVAKATRQYAYSHPSYFALAHRMRGWADALARRAEKARSIFSQRARVISKTVAQVLTNEARGGILYVPKIAAQAWLRGMPSGNGKEKLRAAQLGKIIPFIKTRAACLGIGLYIGHDRGSTIGCVPCHHNSPVDRDAAVVVCLVCGLRGHRDVMAAWRNLIINLDMEKVFGGNPMELEHVRVPYDGELATERLTTYVKNWPLRGDIVALNDMAVERRQRLHLMGHWPPVEMRFVRATGDDVVQPLARHAMRRRERRGGVGNVGVRIRGGRGRGRGRGGAVIRGRGGAVVRGRGGAVIRGRGVVAARGRVRIPRVPGLGNPRIRTRRRQART
jgi:hypothetical protein